MLRGQHPTSNEQSQAQALLWRDAEIKRLRIENALLSKQLHDLRQTVQAAVPQLHLVAANG